MAAAIEKKYGIRSELVPGHRGVFDVSLDGVLVFSKHEKGRFPEAKEIFAHVEKARPGDGPRK